MRGDSRNLEHKVNRSVAHTGIVILLFTLALVPEAKAQESLSPPPTLQAGAIELGVAGNLTTIEGITSGAVLLRGGLFRSAFGGLAGFELATSYRHVSSLDQNGLEAILSWQTRLEQSSSYPFVSIAAGWRHEEIGSFGQSRYPLGFGLGVRSLLGQRSALRVEYQFRRILGDPIADFSEHQVVVGLSVFFRNAAPTGE
ncbi:MAG: hypothetical protein V3V49_11845 [Candidatus Krumholzibacteria bacterium]